MRIELILVSNEISNMLIHIVIDLNYLYYYLITCKFNTYNSIVIKNFSSYSQDISQE